MHRKQILAGIALSALVALSAPALSGNKRDLGTEVLGPGDGWAAAGPGTTGGAAAAPEQIYIVRTRRELIAALNNGVPTSTSPSNPSDVPKIIYVDGVIDANVDDDNQPLDCEDYYRPDPATGTMYSLEAFLAAYDPAVWGRVAPSGPLEAARLASRSAQMARVRIRPGSNTTIVGLGKEATIRGAWIDIRGASSSNRRRNLIIRNLTFQDTYDCFPAWAPTDGAAGNWNAEYDAISLREVENVWIDHNTFRDVDTADHLQPTYFGRPYQVHDGHLDITNASNLVTVSWNRFLDHDKVMLIGSSDGATADRGRLKVTLHHNLFDGVGQRLPRVRFGQVHLYNNYYRLHKLDNFQYAWGVGVESAIYAEQNFFFTDHGLTPDRFVARFNGTAAHVSGTLHTGVPARRPVDVIAAYNAVNDPDLGTDPGWVPVLDAGLQSAFTVPQTVLSGAGPFAW